MEFIENEFNPPYTDRGVENTSPLKNREKNILIDWFQCTIKEKIDPMFIFTSILQIPSNEILREEGGLFSYNYTYSWRDIKIFKHSINETLGTHIYMTGTGCRDFELLNIGWLQLFSLLVDNFECNFTRIDVAIDTFTDKYFTIQKLRDYIDNNQVVSRFKSSTEFMQKSLANHNIESETIWFGSRTSNIQIVFYNKLLERRNASYEVAKEIEHWFRCEMRLKNEIAKNLINIILENGSYTEYINDILYNYIDFKDYNASESNRSRWNTSNWWLEFLNTNKKLSLKVNVKESSITRKRKWLDHSVSKSEFMVYVSNIVKDNYSLDMISSNYIYNQLVSGYEKIKDKDISLINEYRAQNGLQPLDFRDLQDIISNISFLI